MHIQVNGDARSMPAGTTVVALLAELAPAGRKVAVERNGEIVPKSAHGATVLADGDALEVVIAVGGG
ncbi:MAG: sulfur carrier protein ThiS [Betaproteobacteria bacterium]